MRSRLSVSSLALISAGFASVAAAQDNQQLIIQFDEETRETSTARIEQAGENNTADGTLMGLDTFTFFNGETITLAPNGAGIFQDGAGSTSVIEQFGNSNAAAINQDDPVGGGADSSTTRILQGESGNIAENSIAYVDQAGDESTAVIKQNGVGNRSFGAQIGNQDGTASGNEQTHTLDGDDNESQVYQEGFGNSGGVTLTGDENAGLISQRGERRRRQRRRHRPIERRHQEQHG